MKKEWFWWMLTHPFCLILYAVSWFHVWSVCKYGRLAKNLPVLAVCLALWLIWLVRLLLGLHRLGEMARMFSITGLKRKGNGSACFGKGRMKRGPFVWMRWRIIANPAKG